MCGSCAAIVCLCGRQAVDDESCVCMRRSDSLDFRRSVRGVSWNEVTVRTGPNRSKGTGVCMADVWSAGGFFCLLVEEFVLIDGMPWG